VISFITVDQMGKEDAVSLVGVAFLPLFLDVEEGKPFSDDDPK
jgi:hypothetical protein